MYGRELPKNLILLFLLRMMMMNCMMNVCMIVVCEREIVKKKKDLTNGHFLNVVVIFLTHLSLGAGTVAEVAEVGMLSFCILFYHYRKRRKTNNYLRVLLSLHNFQYTSIIVCFFFLFFLVFGLSLGR